MKPIPLALVFAAFLFSCNNAGNDKKADGPDTTQNTAAPRTISDALVDLKSALESRNSDQIADLMDFPLEDTVMNIYLDDSMFQKSYQAAGSKLTRELFRKYYDTIYKFTYLDQVSQIFRHIPLDSLKSKNEVTKEYKDKNEPCTRYYTIHKEQDEVTLTYGTNSNIDYVDKKGKSPDDADVAGCEYSVFWIFKFDGNKLRLVRQTAAG